MEDKKLTPRQWALKRWLEENHIANTFHTIEEVVSSVIMPNGEPAYELNRNPYKHDKCIALSSDVRAINWSISEGYKIIIKDTKGGIKLCENQDEFENWRLEQLKPLETKWKYLNNLKWKSDRNGEMPCINLANNPVNELKEVEVYANSNNE